MLRKNNLSLHRVLINTRTGRLKDIHLYSALVWLYQRTGMKNKNAQHMIEFGEMKRKICPTLEQQEIEKSIALLSHTVNTLVTHS